MQQEDRDFYTSIQAAKVRGKGVKNRRYPDAEEIIEEVPAPAKKQLDQAAVAAIESARAEEAQRNATVMQEAYPEVQMEPIAPQTTRMAAPGRRNRLKDLDPVELEAYKALREEALRERREKNQQAKARGERLRAPAYTEAPPPKKSRPPAPLQSLPPDAAIKVKTQKNRQLVQGPPAGFAQRLRYKFTRKIEGLSSEMWRLETDPTSREQEYMVYSKYEGKKIPLWKSRWNQCMRELARMKSDVGADGFGQWLAALPASPHYKQRTPMNEATIQFWDQDVPQLPLSDLKGALGRTGITEDYTGAARPAYRFGK